MTNITHHAFKHKYPFAAQKLMSDVDVFGISAQTPTQTSTIKALWDTGAGCSVITPLVSKALNLTPIDRTRVNGVNSTSVADKVKISVILPNSVKVTDLTVMVCNLVPGVDMLIGMDIIKCGDFSISNGGNETLFSFVMPPFPDKIDLFEKALMINQHISP
jgi:predicted aspartyl protease